MRSKQVFIGEQHFQYTTLQTKTSHKHFGSDAINDLGRATRQTQTTTWITNLLKPQLGHEPTQTTTWITNLISYTYLSIYSLLDNA